MCLTHLKFVFKKIKMNTIYFDDLSFLYLYIMYFTGDVLDPFYVNGTLIYIVYVFTTTTKFLYYN